MSIIKQDSNSKGSLKDIQILVNNNQDILNEGLYSKFSSLKNSRILWVSPLKQDSYSEYRDNDFLSIVGLDPDKIDLAEFWPNRGPQWDALAKTDKGEVILVEAKANIPEIVSPPSAASSNSKEKIVKSLHETKTFLKIANDADWSGKFYQYTNRIAHLYFLRKKCKIPAYLVNIYFVGDKGVAGPETIKEWEAALKVMKTYLGISKHKLSKYMADLFFHVDHLIK